MHNSSHKNTLKKDKMPNGASIEKRQMFRSDGNTPLFN